MTDITHKLNQARELIDQGRFEQARDTLQRVIRHAPADKQANVLMRHALMRLGEPRQALYYAERALGGSPGDPDLVALAAMSQADAGELDKAVGRLEACVAAHPKHGGARASLARLYLMSHRLGDCLGMCMPALEAGVRDLGLFSVYASALLRAGRADEALPVMKYLVSSSPGGVDPMQLSNLAGAMLLDPTADPTEVFAAHHAFGRVLGQAAPVEEPDWSRDSACARTMDPERKLRVGFFLPVASGVPMEGFLEPLLERLDRVRHEVYVYATQSDGGAMSAACRGGEGGGVVTWRDASRMSPRELCARARADRLDVAIDASGHTAGHALVAMHLRCAPVQASWWTYPYTTGLPAIDYRITDSLVCPLEDGGREAHTVERVVRIDPCGACYRPRSGACAIEPEPPSARAEAGGRVTFVSYGSAERLSSAVVRTWARVLKEVRNARLVLRHPSMGQADTRAHISSRLAAAGAATGTVVVEPVGTTVIGAMEDYNGADVALDTFPLSCVTVMCEALWMGVPVVAMEGERSYRRAGRSVMHAAGLDDLVSRSEDEYVEKAVRLAGDVERRRGLRATLRRTLEESALRDEAGFARKFESAVRAMWREKCAAVAARSGAGRG